MAGVLTGDGDVAAAVAVEVADIERLAGLGRPGGRIVKDKNAVLRQAAQVERRTAGGTRSPSWAAPGVSASGRLRARVSASSTTRRTGQRRGLIRKVI